MSRAFLHTSADLIQFNPGNAVNTTGGGQTSLSLWTPDVIGSAHGLIIARNTSNSTVWGINPYSDDRIYFTSSGFVATDTIAASTWYLLGITKAAGSSQVRTHFYSYTSGLWTHTNWGALSDSASGPVNNMRIGWFSGTDMLTGKIAAMALYNKVLTDLEIEALTTSFDDWLGKSPIWAVKLNQAATTTAVFDQSGGNGNQASISGTTVSASEPAGWSYGGWNLLDSGGVGFTDGNAGHIFTFPGGAAVDGDLLAVAVASDTTVSTPAGWTLGVPDVGNQAAYIFYKRAAGGETSVTITTSGNFPTSIAYLRYLPPATFRLDQFVAARSITSGSTTPSGTTGALSNTGELSIAVAALHGLQGGSQTSPIWSATYGQRVDITSGGTTSTDTHLFVATNTNAGIAAQSPNCSWTGPTNDQTLLVATFGPATAQIINLGLPVDTGVAMPFKASKQVNLGLPVDTGVALPFGRQKQVNLGIATETDIALPFGRQKIYHLGIATENDIALPVRLPTKRTVHLQLNYRNQTTTPDLTVDMNS